MNQTTNQQQQNPGDKQAPNKVPGPTSPVKEVPNQNDKDSVSPVKE